MLVEAFEVTRGGDGGVLACSGASTSATVEITADEMMENAGVIVVEEVGLNADDEVVEMTERIINK
jgi:hypothetical protein